MINLSLSQRGLLGVSILIGVLLVATLSYISWNWRGDWVVSHRDLAVKPLVATRDNSAAMIAGIADAHIFGKSFNALGSVPLSSLQFKVTGIAKIDQGKQGRLSKAYISLSGGTSKIFQVGDNLPYGVKVYDITPDTVILENDGHLEKLTLAREKLEFKAKNSLERRSDA